MPAFVFVAFNDLICGNFLRVGFGHFLVLDRAVISSAQLAETEFLFSGRRINGNGNVNEPEADTAFPNWSHDSSVA